MPTKATNPRKSKQDFDFEELCRGLLDSLLRIRVS